jgi:hypothetical protein
MVQHPCRRTLILSFSDYIRSDERCDRMPGQIR